MHTSLGDFTVKGNRLAYLTMLALAIGTAGAIVAVLLLDLIGFITHVAYFGTLTHTLVAPSLHMYGRWSVLIPVIGGLVVGLIARYGSEKIRGHGIPEAIQSILERESCMDVRVAVLKPLASAITIGTGGPFGAEGPIIMTGGAFGSLFAQYFHLSALERRTLLVAGAAAGMSAIFNAPIASVFLAVELLLFEWRPRSFIPVAVASMIADVIRMPLLGSDPIFPGISTNIVFGGPALFAAIALGLAIGICSCLLTAFMYAMEDGYHYLPVHWMWWPALGGLFVGLGGLVDPRALGVGYGTLTALVNGQLHGTTVYLLLFVKTLIWVIALSSGTSGGVLAPLLIIGACIGSLASPLLPGQDVSLWATVGMAAMLCGAMGTPFMATIFALETTHAWLDAPMIFSACIAAMAVTVIVMRRSILTEKVARKGTHVAREYAVHPLEGIALTQAMVPRKRVITLPVNASVSESLQQLSMMLAERRHVAYPVVDARDNIVGIVEHSEISAWFIRNRNISIADIMLRPMFVHSERRLRSAVERMAIGKRHALIVIDNKKNWIGFLVQGDVLRAWQRGIYHERRRIRIRTFARTLR